MANDTDIAKILAAFMMALEDRHPGILQEIEKNLQHVDSKSLGQALWFLRQVPGSRPDHEKTKEWTLSEAGQELHDRPDSL